MVVEGFSGRISVLNQSINKFEQKAKLSVEGYYQEPLKVPTEELN